MKILPIAALFLLFVASAIANAQTQSESTAVVVRQLASDSQTIYMTEVGGLDQAKVKVIAEAFGLTPVGDRADMTKLYRVLGTDLDELDANSLILIHVFEGTPRHTGFALYENDPEDPDDDVDLIMSMDVAVGDSISYLNVQPGAGVLALYPRGVDLEADITLENPKKKGSKIKVTAKLKAKIKVNGRTVVSGSATKSWTWDYREANCLTLDHDYGAILVDGKVCYNGDEVCFKGKIGLEGSGYKKWSGTIEKCVGL